MMMSVPTPLTYQPTAVQSLMVGQDTLTRALLVAPGGVPGSRSFQLVPSQRSESVAVRLNFVKEPTATHFDAAGQDTPASELSTAPDLSGVLCAVQLDPFQRSARVSTEELVE